ncbi:hypothetical protein GCM10027614_57240 [Micromonospora vulcania]
MLPEPVEVLALPVGGRLVAVAGVLGDVFRDVPDGSFGVLGAGHDAAGVDLGAEAHDVHRFRVRVVVIGVERFRPGGQ